MSGPRLSRLLSVREFLRGGAAALAFAGGGGRSWAGTELVDVGGSAIEISFDPNAFDVPADQITNWVKKAANAVSTYYAAFPVPRMRVHIESSDERSGVFHGTTWGYVPPLTRIFVGRHTTEKQLDADWMMTHELVHTAFPDVPDEHHWMEEGIATYVEPIARVQAGQLNAGKIWADMVQGMPQGEPQPGDAGLDHTHTWGRTYWGGALFCLNADVRIRVATQNRAGLQQALRGIMRAGGTIDKDWSIAEALRVGDKATRSSVLTDLYNGMKDKPMAIDLPSLWRNLGVRVDADGGVSFDSGAPWAATRAAITGRVQP